MDNEMLLAEGIEYPIKLEYYKTIEIEKNVEAKYGIEIVKTEFKNGETKVENSIIENVTNSSQDIEGILTVLRNNQVTPIGMQDVLSDMFTKVNY